MFEAKKPSRRLTLQDAVRIWKLHSEGWFQNRIAALLDVNPGRINEVIKGKKFPESHKIANNF